MTVHSSTQIGAHSAAGSLKSATTDHKKSTATSFSKALKDASTTAQDTTAAKAPSGEKTTPVEGHKYADITAGPRKGLFLNTGTTARAGDAFVMVRKNGREYHIYGTGSHRHVFSIKLDDTKSSSSSTSSTSSDTSSATGTTDTGKINTDSSTTSGS
jgi:hypothetical protein